MAEVTSRPSFALRHGLLPLTLGSFYALGLSADDEKVVKQLAKLDAQCVRALIEPAKR